MKPSHPNIVFVFGDQWRAQALGYAGDPNVRTPNLDAFAARSLRFTQSISTCPVCCPWRATLMTGQNPLTHGVFVNDVPVRGEPAYLAQWLGEAGYDTAYIGKWHIDGHGRSSYIPPERRKGFRHWRAQECTHDYNASGYYADDPAPRRWPGYDAEAQTEEAIRYLRSARDRGPFMMMLSWGPPHDPYGTAPERYRRMYDPASLVLRPNVPDEREEETRAKIAGYYAHCSALDACFGRLADALETLGLADDTLLVFTSDHGDMLGSHLQWNKQRPFEESIMTPMLMRWPSGFGSAPRTVTNQVASADIMPTLIGLAGLPVPATVEGRDLSEAIRRNLPPDGDEATLIELPACFHQYAYYNGGRDWRGLRTARHTYVIDHQGPWMLFDNAADPYQMRNLVAEPSTSDLRSRLDRRLRAMLEARGDRFERGADLIRQVGYHTDQRGDPVYSP